MNDSWYRSSPLPDPLPSRGWIAAAYVLGGALAILAGPPTLAIAFTPRPETTWMEFVAFAVPAALGLMLIACGVAHRDRTRLMRVMLVPVLGAAATLAGGGLVLACAGSALEQPVECSDSEGTMLVAGTLTSAGVATLGSACSLAAAVRDRRPAARRAQP